MISRAVSARPYKLGRSGGSGGVSSEKLAAMASNIAGGDFTALKALAAQLTSTDGITEYEQEEVRKRTGARNVSLLYVIFSCEEQRMETP